MVDPLPPCPTKGRGALGNAAGRFEAHSRLAVDDGWDIDDDMPPLRTTVTDEVTRAVLSWNSSPDIPFDRSINPYKGCAGGFPQPVHRCPIITRLY